MVLVFFALCATVRIDLNPSGSCEEQRSCDDALPRVLACEKRQIPVRVTSKKAQEQSCAFLLCFRPRRTLVVRWVDVENRFDFQAVKPSCPLRKALIMLFRGELSEGR